MEYILLIIGFLVIIKASDILVDASTSIATRMRIPKMIIALTVVAFGTCAPELAISFQSIGAENGSMALANVIGSCIVNVLLIVGLAAFIRPIQIKKQTIKKELPLLIIITLGLIGLTLDKLFLSESHILGRVDGYLLLVLFTIFIYYVVNAVRKNRDYMPQSTIKYPIVQAIIYLIVSIVLITFSSDMIVDSSIMIANNFGISQKIITLVVIVVGTSFPELVMTITASKKNEFEIAMGNIIGTNIFNICVVLGLPLIFYNKLAIVDFNIIDLIFLFLSSFVLFLFARSERKISKLEGVIMILIFLSYYGYAIFLV